MASREPEPAYDDYRRISRERVFAFLLEGRFVLIPGPFLLAAVFFFVEPMLWRRILLLSIIPVAIALAVWERARYRRRTAGGVGGPAVPINMSAMLVLALAVFVATGGIASPVVFVFPISIFVASILGDPRHVRVAVGIDIAAAWAFAYVEETPSMHVLVPEHFRTVSALQTWLTAATLTIATLVATFVGRRIAMVFDGMLKELTDARDEARRSHEEQTQALTLLSGEIAHELKNPLASVKGLAALVAKDAQGKSAEHLAVLRREVDRMQLILDEFLNFSRPLVPLALTDVDLGDLAADVAGMHAGAERERGVRVEAVAEGDARVRADARKVKQVLVNLVQNAIDASPTGAAVRVVARAQGDGAVVEVRDRGPGLPDAVAARVFEPGVTSKAKGSGLGLTIARALARQHGGDVELTSTERGCVATLRLPRDARSVATGGQEVAA